MQSVYTEASLKPMKKVELYEILLTLGIEMDKSTSKDEMIVRILANTLSTNDGGENILESAIEAHKDESKESEGDTTPSDEESVDTGEQGANDGNDETPTNDGLPKYSPEQLIKSSTYSHRRDVLRTLLDDDKTYSHAQIAAMLKAFYESEDVTLNPIKEGEEA